MFEIFAPEHQQRWRRVADYVTLRGWQ